MSDQPQPSDPVGECMTERGFTYDKDADLYSKNDSFWFSGMQARYLYLSILEGRRDELVKLEGKTRVGHGSPSDREPFVTVVREIDIVKQRCDLDRQISAVKGQKNAD